MPAWGRLSRTSWIEEPRDVKLRDDGLRVATPLRMLFRLARTFNDHRFERAAEDAWHRGLVTPQAAAEYLDAIRRSGKAGVLRFEGWLMKTDGAAASSAEWPRARRARRPSPGGPARAGAPASAHPAQWRDRSTSTLRGRPSGWAWSPATAGGTGATSVSAPTRRVTGRATRSAGGSSAATSPSVTISRPSGCSCGSSTTSVVDP